MYTIYCTCVSLSSSTTILCLKVYSRLFLRNFTQHSCCHSNIHLCTEHDHIILKCFTQDLCGHSNIHLYWTIFCCHSNIHLCTTSYQERYPSFPRCYVHPKKRHLKKYNYFLRGQCPCFAVSMTFPRGNILHKKWKMGHGSSLSIQETKTEWMNTHDCCPSVLKISLRKVMLKFVHMLQQ